ncbi:MAG: hypothetical protein US94_C0026G0016, partial [Berkelbacteria bacterium GW2011_GWB1_38_5]
GEEAEVAPTQGSESRPKSVGKEKIEEAEEKLEEAEKPGTIPEWAKAHRDERRVVEKPEDKIPEKPKKIEEPKEKAVEELPLPKPKPNDDPNYWGKKLN